MSRSAPILPYRVLPRDFVLPSPQGWTAVVDGQQEIHLTHGTAFSSWDAKLAFRLERTFCIPRNVAQELRIDSKESCCELVVSGSTGGGSSRKVLFRQTITAAATEINAIVRPSSEHLAKELLLTAGLYLSCDISSDDPLAPSLRGSRLWEISDRIRLEGGATRLPLYEVPFSQMFVGDRMEKADFHVEIADDPELDIETALSVYLNSERPDFVREASQAGSEAERQLWSGIVRRALMSAVLGDGYLTEHLTDGNSMGSTVQRWARFIWPNTPSEKLRDLPFANYSTFESQIDSWLRSLEEDKVAGGSPS